MNDLHAELLECTKALEALNGAQVAYRIYGSVMVKRDVEALKTELQARIKELEEGTQNNG